MHVDWIVEFTHGSFSLADSGDVISDIDITDEAIAARAHVNDDRTGIAIFAPRYSQFARLQIELTNDRPSLSFDEWDHVVEACFCTLSGGIEIYSTCGDMVYETSTREHVRGALPIEPGIYCLYVLIANLASVERRLHALGGSDRSAYQRLFYGSGEEGVPDDETLMSYERYRIMLWPVVNRVVKRFDPLG